MLFFLKRNLGITALKRIFVGCSIYTIIKCSLQVFTQQRNSIFGIFFLLNHCTTIHIMFHHFLCFFHRNTVFQQIVCNVLCLFICESCHIILFLNRIIFLSKCRNSGCRNGRKIARAETPAIILIADFFIINSSLFSVNCILLQHEPYENNVHRFKCISFHSFIIQELS